MKLTKDQILALKELLNSRGFSTFTSLLSVYREGFDNDDIPSGLADFLERERNIGARVALKGLVKFITDTIETEETKLKDIDNERGE